MAETTRDTKSLVDDFNDQQDAPPKYEQLSNYGQATGYPQGVHGQAVGYPQGVQGQAVGYPQGVHGQAPGYPQGGQTTHNMVVIAQPSLVVPRVQEQRPQAAGYIILSCCVFWCCCWPLGLVAFIFAIMATSDVHASTAKAHLKVSSILSIVGIVAGILILIILVIYLVVAVAFVENQEQYDSNSYESSDFDDYY